MPDQVPSDGELMTLYISGDASAFNELYRRHAPRVYAYLLKRLKSRQDADEVHQAVFFKFHASRHLYDPKFAALQWLYVISRTVVLDFYRKQKRQVPIVEGIAIEQAENIQPALSQEPGLPSLTEIEGLTPEQRRIVEWRFIDSMSFEEISAQLGKSQANVRQILSRAVRKIRSTFAQKGSGA